jgi:hypothetical protein
MPGEVSKSVARAAIATVAVDLQIRVCGMTEGAFARLGLPARSGGRLASFLRLFLANFFLASALRSRPQPSYVKNC